MGTDPFDDYASRESRSPGEVSPRRTSFRGIEQEEDDDEGEQEEEEPPQELPSKKDKGTRKAAQYGESDQDDTENEDPRPPVKEDDEGEEEEEGPPQESPSKKDKGKRKAAQYEDLEDEDPRPPLKESKTDGKIQKAQTQSKKKENIGMLLSYILELISLSINLAREWVSEKVNGNITDLLSIGVAKK